MITFKSFLSEETEKFFDLDTFDMEKFLTDTKKFRARSGGHEMFHGSRGLSADWTGKTQGGLYSFYERRAPKDTLQVYHDIMNYYFQVTFGAWRARNWMFTSGSAKQTRQYGTVYVIYPVGEFSCLGSTDNRAKDMYETILSMVSQLGKDMGYGHLDPEEAPDAVMDAAEEALEATLASMNFKLDKDLDDLLAHGNEIMFKCEHFYAIKQHTDLHNAILRAK